MSGRDGNCYLIANVCTNVLLIVLYSHNAYVLCTGVV